MPDEADGELMGYPVEIRYWHAEDGRYYRHEFSDGVLMLAQEDGTVLLAHPDKDLWGDY